MKKLLCLMLTLVLLTSALASCQSKTVGFSEIDFRTVSDMSKVSTTDKKTDYVIIDVKDYGQILIRLFPDVAPKTVKNFKELVAEGFYDGVIFHRVWEDFMIQGGDPDGDGTGGSDKTIVGEFNENGFKNNLKHVRGVVSMARTADMNSASSQFFICQEEYNYGNGKYASFGFVVNGMSVVDAIAAVEVSASSKRPYTDVVINSIRFAEVPEEVLSDTPEPENTKKDEDTVIEDTVKKNSDFDLSEILNEVYITKSDVETNYVCLDIENYGEIYLRLYPETAPQTVANFKKLVSEGFYDGLTFHRIIKNFMIQGGDPDGDGTGGSPDKIYGEFLNNGFNNQLKHTRGVISMARSPYDYNSASSQFFICQEDYDYGDGDYASFGYVIKGMDVVDSIASIPTNSLDRPIRDVKISAAYFVNIPNTALAKGINTIEGAKTTDEKTNYVLMDIENYGEVVIRLYPETAPLTVENFRKLVSEGFYDGLTFHRVIKNSIIQGGDPLGTGYGDSGETIVGEFSANGITNDVNHIPGVISMARLANQYDSASCQFFICHAKSSGFDGKYAAFGYVIYGFDVIDEIANCETNSDSNPIEPIIIKSIKFIDIQE